MSRTSISQRCLLSVVAAVLSFATSSIVHAQECVPQCRAGFICLQGQCVSACNPPCASYEQCSADGQCSAAAPAVAPAPAAPGSAAPGPAYLAAPYTTAPPPPSGGYAPPPAAGQPASLTPTAEAAPGEASGKRARTHDGFYMQLALGAGWVAGSGESKGTGGLEVELTGIGQLGHVAIGTTVAPGLVIGGGIYGVNLFGGTYAYGPKNVNNFTKIEEDANFSAASMFGPFLAYYFDPEQGAYVVGAPGYGLVSGGKSDTLPETSGGGFAFMLGGGYDFWVGEQWSVGAMGRFQYFSVELEDDDSGAKVDFTALVPGVLFSATYH